MSDNKNIIKVREDSTPISLEKSGDKFSVSNKQNTSSWLSSNEVSEIKLSNLRSGIEPWLTSLFQSEHLSLLTGTGLSIAVQYLAANFSGSAMSKPELNNDFVEEIEKTSAETASKSNRGEANIEDYIRVMNELLCGLEILGYNSGDDSENKTKFNKLKDNLSKVIADFTNDISKIEYQITTADTKKREEAFGYLVNFLMCFASRTGTRERLNLFTTNYDRIIEAGSEIAGIHLLDRFIGTLAPIFRSSRLDIDMHYNPPGIRGEPRYLEGVARFTKLHGSIDWINTGDDIRRIGLPFGSEDMKNFLNAPGISNGDVGKIMIYPNSAKDRETTEYPYVELFRDFATALCRPNSTLITYGYGFGDDHINRIIRDMLTIPSTHLVIISYNDVDGRIMKKYEEFGRSSQISLIIGKDLADLKILVDYFLPKPSIDRATMRMSELLKQRYSLPQVSLPDNNEGSENSE
jgi:hypothetical protein